MNNINDKAINTIVECMSKLIDKKLESFQCTKVFPSIIKSINPDSTYTIIKGKNKYDVKNGLGVGLNEGQSVWVMIPNGQIKDMFVCGIR